MRTWDPSAPGNGYWERIAAASDKNPPAKPFEAQRLTPSLGTRKLRKPFGLREVTKLADGRRQVKCRCGRVYIAARKGPIAQLCGGCGD